MYYDKSGAIAGKKERPCYLPKGCNWYDFWSGVLHEGEQTVYAGAKLDEIPLFVKAGSILLIQQPTTYAQQKADALELRIYRGADGDCVYYQDDGTTYAYEQGLYEEVRFHWDDLQQELTIREVKKHRSEPIRMIIRVQDFETIIRYDGGEKRISFN
jgi:alpha-D-xyloside xylohydrolase